MHHWGCLDVACEVVVSAHDGTQEDACRGAAVASQFLGACVSTAAPYERAPLLTMAGSLGAWGGLLIHAWHGCLRMETSLDI